MNKRLYSNPTINVVDLHGECILAGSTGATGEDVPWAAKRRKDSLYDNELDEFENEFDNIY